MSIADNIEKEFAKLLRESRSAARHKLVAEAADKEDAIRAKRPRKEKNKKSVIEEAHPEEVFVAESDGLGGRVGNPEQVQEQILDALNRRPSAFPYQGLVANAMADFEKTAEVLESHDLFNEAAAVRKVAADWLAVLERRGNLKKKAADPDVIDFLDDTGGAYESTTSSSGGQYSSTASSTAQPSPSTTPPASGAVPAEAPPPSASASAETATEAAKAAEKADQTKATTAIAKVTEKVDEAKDAAKTADSLKDAAKVAPAAAKASGAFAKALSFLGIIGDAITVGTYALDRDWTSVIGVVGAGGAAAAVAALSAPVATAVGGIAAASGIGVGVYTAINETILGAWQEDLETDVKDAIGQIDDLIKDDDIDPARRASAQKAKDALETIPRSVAEIRRQASQSATKSDMSAIATGLAQIADAIYVAKESADELKENTVFDIGVRQAIAAIDDVVGESFDEFNETLQRDLGSKWPEFQDILKTIIAAQKARKSIIGDINIYSSGSGSAAGSQQSASAPAPSPAALSSDDPDHIKEVQAAINDFQASDAGFNPKLALTGKWDAPTIEALRAYVRLWLRVDTNLAQVISVDSLKKSTGDIIKDVNDLYRNKEAEIAAIMRGSANK